MVCHVSIWVREARETWARPEPEPGSTNVACTLEHLLKIHAMRHVDLVQNTSVDLVHGEHVQSVKNVFVVFHEILKDQIAVGDRQPAALL